MGTIRIGRWRAGAAFAGVLCAAAGIATASALAATPPVWTAPVPADGAPANPLVAVSCISTSLCVGVDSAGGVVSSTAPVSAPATWAQNAAAGALTNGLSCPLDTFCITVGAAGAAKFSAAPSATSGAWTTVATGDSTHTLNDVSCPSAALCFAVDNAGNVVSSTTPTTGPWVAPLNIDGVHSLTAISCPTASLCVAVDNAGNVLASTTPTTAPWSTTPVSTVPLTAVSCNSAALCVATANNGSVYATAKATSSPVTWSATPLDPTGVPLAVSCTDGGLCVVVDANGTAFSSDTAPGGVPAWAPASIDPPANGGLGAVSCVATGFCVAVDASGNAIAGTLTVPATVTGTGVASSQTTATLAGAVDPGDAILADCHFDYGPTAAYGTSVPCATLPAPAGGAQVVTAQISGLTASTTYHFRVAAANGVSASGGGDATFTTPAALIASPSLGGTPGVGSTLVCKPNVTIPATLTVVYAWLSDTVAIPGAALPSYVVAAADESHHLSCQVTISGDGGSTTATSGFVAVPANKNAKIIESFVSSVKHTAGAVKAAVSCSPQATGSCTFTLTLSTKQTVGGRIQNVVVGKKTAKVATGTARTLSVSLNPAGQLLLTKKRKLAVTSTVDGTVLGTLSATLRTDKFVLTAKATKHTAKKSRKHAATRTR